MADPTATMTTRRRAARPVAAVLAVKGLADAKTRLSPVVSADARRALVLAMMSDTMAGAWAAGVDEIVVVTPDPEVGSVAVEFGAHIVADGDPDGDRRTSSLNRAIRRGVDVARATSPSARVVILQADLPALRADHLTAVIDAAAPHRQSMVPDRSGSGTAILLLDHRTAVTPRFGPDSAAAHRASGVVDLVAHADDLWLDLRTDVDTVDDLAHAVALGVGAHTARVLLDADTAALPTAPTPHAS